MLICKLPAPFEVYCKQRRPGIGIHHCKYIGKLKKEIGVVAKNADNETRGYRCCCDLIKDSYYHCCPLRPL